MDELRSKLQEELDTVDWRALRIHAGRDSVILADPVLDLVDVAWCVARDRSAEVTAWIGSGQLRKPSVEELSAWEREPGKCFRMLIVTPYVLIQTV